MAADVGLEKRSVLAWAGAKVEDAVRRAALMGAEELSLLAHQWRH
jgi:hypothetical protein